MSVINEYLLTASSDNNISVIKTAPTGVAAFNIQGVTLHRAFYLPGTHKNRKSNDYTSLNPERLQQLRNLYQRLPDEIQGDVIIVKPAASSNSQNVKFTIENVDVVEEP